MPEDQMSFPPSPLMTLLETFRAQAQTPREKGTYFEKLVKLYLTEEPYYADLYGGKVWLWEEWRQESRRRFKSDPGPDAGIDLVAETKDGELHAVQAKFYAADAQVNLETFGTFFTASSKKLFSRRLIVLTATRATTHLQAALADQNPPVNLITLYDLERSKIDWQAWTPDLPTAPLKARKELRPYQETAIADVTAGLATADRGKLIMACGTGKTFTSLRLAESMAGKGGQVLFLVPSLNLLSQTLTEWTQETAIGLHSFAVCSDSEVGKKRSDSFNDFEMQVHELQYPATTQAATLAKAVKARHDNEHLTVIFSTYHSIEVISRAQHDCGLPEFDLILCDEAHRTTGASFEGEEESAFVKVHDQTVIRGRKRVYMTATPRIYGPQAKVKAEKDNTLLYSMNNEEHYGKTLHTLTFSEAVNDLKILCDYKVIVLTIGEDHISRSLQDLLASPDNSINVNDAAKIVGCWRALSKMDSLDDLGFDPAPMRRAVAFAQVIELKKGAKTHKISSKHIAATFEAVVDEYRRQLIRENPDNPEAISRLRCEASHVDGSMGAVEKEEKLAWLKAEPPADTCRILSNVRCLSEGVDVPALDAVLFLTPRNSQVEVVQSVGRVMRKPRDGSKKLGYVILPVVIPTNKTPEEALNDNQTYRVVWEVLQALRSHDDRFDTMINRMRFDGPDPARMEVIAVTDKLPKGRRARADGGNTGKALTAKRGHAIGQPTKDASSSAEQMTLEIGDLERAILAKVVERCGNRLYWDEWATDIAHIAQTHISRLTAILENPANKAEIAAFDAFLADLHADLNDSIGRTDAIEMLAQHLITRPVFDALFEGYSFAEHNPVSKAMQGMLAVLERHNLGKETDTLARLYVSVRHRAEETRTLAGRQKLIVELYDKFFRNAFPRLTDRLGIVYTPVEVVDFIIHSVNDVLKAEFGQTLGSKGVHILDPFTGTGTFITRLLQSGLIPLDQLPEKFARDIHANEIVLLAYYIAAINIEQVYHSLAGGDYTPFEGICLTDTFNLPTGKSDLVEGAARDNSARLKRQRKLDIRVILGNPPYSVGQKSENDNNNNLAYPALDGRIRETYGARSDAKLSKGLYDSYVRAIRWASDRIGNSGVIGFVTNAGFVEAKSADGLRRCLTDEFSSIYVFHLRGLRGLKTAGERAKQEGGQIFEAASGAAICISLLVKNPAAKKHGKIYFHNIGDYLNRRQKLDRIADFGSIEGIEAAGEWRDIVIDAHGDWLKQRDASYAAYMPLGDKKGGTQALFEKFSLGVVTNRDAWCVNASREHLAANMRRMITFYNAEVERFRAACANAPEKNIGADSFVSNDPTEISWTRALRHDLEKIKKFEFSNKSITTSMYRPFSKQHMYFNRNFNEMVYQMPYIFCNEDTQNLAIGVPASATRGMYSALMVRHVPSLHAADMVGSQYFPMYWHETIKTGGKDSGMGDMFAQQLPKRVRRDAISDAGLAHFQAAYPGEAITKEDLFYYVYGLLHSEDYRTRFADNLAKELPRIPAVKTASAFRAFVQAGRDLGHLHVDYETVPMYPATLDFAKPRESLTAAEWRVEKMRFAKGTDGARHDKSTVVYNPFVTIRDIPLEAYDYVVNGKPALEWVMERQAVTTDKASGIVNDANDWAVETMHNPAYPFELFLRVITVSLETMKIVRSLPPLDID